MSRGDSNLECRLGCSLYTFVMFFPAFTLFLR